MSCANSFVKNELQETSDRYAPEDGFYNVLDPCSQCASTKRSKTARPWQICVRRRRSCVRKGEEHPLPTIRRVHVSDLREERDFACVFENDGGAAITWDKQTTRCRVPCDRCWSLAQCTRMNHALDACPIPFLDIDDAPGVTPAKRSCKSTSPLGHAKTPGSGGSRESKQARGSPSSSSSPAASGQQADASSSPPAPLVTPSPPPPRSRLPAVPPAAVAAVTPRSSPPSGGGSGGSSGESPHPVGGGGNKGKRPARRHAGGAAGVERNGGADVGNDPRSPSPDVAAGAGAGSGTASGGGGSVSGGSRAGGVGAGAGTAGTSVQSADTSRGNDVYVQSLRERVESAASQVQKAVKYLTELDKIKLHASAQIRDGERMLKMTKLKEQQVQKLVVEIKSKEADAKRQLKAALAGSAAKLKQQAAQLEREAQLLS
eukprot:g2563.t1